MPFSIKMQPYKLHYLLFCLALRLLLLRVVSYFIRMGCFILKHSSVGLSYLYFTKEIIKKIYTVR